MYGDADLLLSSYSVPLEYDPDLIQEVLPLYCMLYCQLYCLATSTACPHARPAAKTSPPLLMLLIILLLPWLPCRWWAT